MCASAFSVAQLLTQAQDHHLKHVFARKHLVNLTQAILSANHSTYQAIMVLDKSLRDDAVSPHLRIGANPVAGFGQSEEGLTLQRYISFLARQFGQSVTHYPEIELTQMITKFCY